MYHKTTLRSACIAGLLALTASAVLGQTTDEEAIKKAVRAETETYYNSDAEGWEAVWLHDTNSTRTLVANNSYSTITGWSNFGPDMVKAIKERKPIPIELKSDNFIIRADGNLAWVEYDQYMNLPGRDPKDRRFSREYRVLVRQNGEWKIGSQITHDPETFKVGPQNIENNLNDIGYALIRNNKVKEAIDVFQVNVRLNPNSANCYDSLGEAYALDGDKPQAIQNYEKAIALDPKRENCKAALAKLKE
jgi:tetratricopeptide (TPR) repeat protein